MLGADVVVVQLQRLAQRELEGLLRPGGERDVPAEGRGAGADDGRDLAPGGLKRHPHALKRAAGEPVGLAEQPEQDMLGADVVVLHPAGLFLGQDDGVPGAVGESLKHDIQGRQTT